ncbi:MAG: hypothetical protein HY918_03700 [Candidatus Doudnabacteria bacterium]|nr:hypothetical protein [Candidatus Doudnabacteria bacterium]
MLKKLLFYTFSSLLLAAAPTLALAAGTIQTVTETIAVGKTLSVGLGQSPTGNWYVLSNANPSAASAVLGFNTEPLVLISGQSAGSSEIKVCSEQSAINCLVVKVAVSGNVLGASVFNSHAIGSWVISDGTVYYVSSNGLIPIPTWEIFLSNGGKQADITEINNGDMQLPLLPLMSAADSRVR